jgi:hypothetical protein
MISPVKARVVSSALVTVALVADARVEPKARQDFPRVVGEHRDHLRIGIAAGQRRGIVQHAVVCDTTDPRSGGVIRD